jgi:2-polyprenyl-3-methyl-5-hydroxy-6-metoxy-1,4-benzoquinol methylase
MSAPALAEDGLLEQRARQSLGSSDNAIYEMVAQAVRSRRIYGDLLVDVGCGRGALWNLLQPCFSSYCGIDAVRYDGFPSDGVFRKADLDGSSWPIEPNVADLVVSLETIEHLENPWAFARNLVRIAKPGAWVVITTPNQLSWLSLLSLIVRHRFSAFTDRAYPAHRTALLESDLRRLASESRLDEIAVGYSHRGRVPLTPWHHPRAVARLLPRALSDNLMLIARKPRD